ncbi:uncharacterized protein SPPG_09228 [Spizellomyces punctatus DAOM BR117]|uniref:LysM domain-containing protein n=1 Tax=Spizellomyces punctatus (strain DAOM BR117) TaxID=645134 RepID=A0A0L0HFB1_SPIPD|nr:uncharacterized protein SPPG_09228 [Spizellomyces punctatus DAOM BR117]KNC99483.1 hypothetical protein SPPG_09228 [Spizellomyces punctatus DAOM BR117]|eukprot:XP_016607523.1 hypothetical protein SPPG_09228 [Spizellomyces punctatus DAOM BR117]
MNGTSGPNGWCNAHTLLSGDDCGSIAIAYGAKVIEAYNHLSCACPGAVRPINVCVFAGTPTPHRYAVAGWKLPICGSRPERKCCDQLASSCGILMAANRDSVHSFTNLSTVLLLERS